MSFSYVPVAAALALLKHAEGDGAQSAPAAIEFPPLLALASTCRALRAALQPRRAQLAKACWLRAFGAESLGVCAAWQRVEQLGGSAFEARWRWLHRLRNSKKSTRAETVVELVLPNREQLRQLASDLPIGTISAVVGDGTQLKSFFPESVTLVASGDVDGASLVEALAVTGEDICCRITFALRTGATVHIKVPHSQNIHVSSYGGIGVELQSYEGRESADVMLQDMTADAELHVLRRSVEPWVSPGDQHWHWAIKGVWSMDGARLAVWGPPRSLVGSQPDSAGKVAVYVFELDAANPPPPGPLHSAHMLLLPGFAALAFGGSSGDRIYTAMSVGEGVLMAWNASSGQLLAEVAITYGPMEHLGYCTSSIVPYRDVLCISMDRPSIDVRCTTTLALVGQLERAPLLGGHATRVVVLCGVADVLFSCDKSGVVLAWHVPTRQLLHRLGRDVLAAPLATHIVGPPGSVLVLTSRGLAMLESDYDRRHQLRLFDWLP